LGHGYDVDLQGKFDKTPIVVQIEITAKEEIPWRSYKAINNRGRTNL
jgi:hypothetical protein